MLKFKPYTMDELRARAAASFPANEVQQQDPQPRPVNVQAVLDLGTLAYFHWRGRSYGVPPMPWKRGAALLDAYLEARNLGEALKRDDLPVYFGAMKRMADILWRSTRPTGAVSRILHSLHLSRNPFREATEAELAEVALFYLGRRMKTGGIRDRAPMRHLSPTI